MLVTVVSGGWPRIVTLDGGGGGEGDLLELRGRDGCMDDDE